MRKAHVALCDSVRNLRYKPKEKKQNRNILRARIIIIWSVMLKRDHRASASKLT